MNLKRTARTAAPALAGVLLLAALGGSRPGFASPVATGSERLESLATQTPAGNWTCPMHPEIHQHGPGKCPICKMKLVTAKPKSV